MSASFSVNLLALLAHSLNAERPEQLSWTIRASVMAHQEVIHMLD